MKNRAILILVLLASLALSLTWGFVLMWRIFSLFVLVLLLSYLWTRLSIRGITGEVKESSEHYQVGEWVEQEVTVFNKSKIPKAIVKIQESTDMPGPPNITVVNLASNGSYRWQSKVYCQRRGRYSIGTFTATVTDPFGFFPSRMSFGKPQNILVCPATVDLSLFQPLSGGEIGFGPGRWLANEIGQNAARVREYASGDTLKQIHWHTTAHTGKLMIKEFDAERSDSDSKGVWIIPDMHQASQIGDNETTEEYSITIAASLIKKYINNGKQVGLIASGDETCRFQLDIGEQHSRYMLQALALIKATGQTPIDQLISQETELLRNGSAAIIITPSVTEQTITSFRHLKECGVSVVVILLDAPSFGGKVSAIRTARNLISSDIHVYIIRRGDDLARALDSQSTVPSLKYITPR